MPQYTESGYEKGRELLILLHDLAKKPFIIPIPGSRKPERLKENLGAAEIVLGKEEIAEIDEKLNTTEFDVFGGH